MHAEVDALLKAGPRARGATLYVTLEPCCHTGRTGPCTDEIKNAGIRRVVFAEKDPDPRVNGRGARALRQAGIQVTGGVLAGQAIDLNEAHYHFHRTGRPFVVVKYAQSLDGRVATVVGDSKWISGPEALRFAHQLRAESCAVVVGSGTVAADDPALTVRRVKGVQPYRIVFSSSLEFPRRGRLFEIDSNFRTIIVSKNSAIKQAAKTKWGRNVMFWAVKSKGRSRLDIEEFLRKAASFGLKSILVEGGPTLVTSFLKSGFVDKIVVIVSPSLIGSGTDSIGELEVKRISQAVRLERIQVQLVGRDFVLTGYPVRRRK